MKRTIVFSLTLLLLTASLAEASIVLTGDCSPASSGDWSSTVDGIVGVADSSTGGVAIDGGSSLESNNCYVAAGSGSTGTFMVSGSGSTFTAADTFYAGQFGTGSLTVESGGVLSSAIGRVGNDGGSNGTALVTGSGSQWNNSSYMLIGGGAGAQGTLNITDSGSVSCLKAYVGSNTGSTGAVNISNNGVLTSLTEEFRVGSHGNATLMIESGGVVNAERGVVAYYEGSTSSATVTGSGSAWNNNSYLVVGRDVGTQGTLTITDSASVTNTSCDIGQYEGSNGAVTVSNNATWTSSDTLHVGEDGTGSLTIQSGGIVNSLNGRMGYNATGNGTALITGAGSQWNTSGGSIILGYNSGAQGSMTITDYATVTNGKSYVGHASGTTGTVTVSDHGTWNCTADSLRVASSGTGTLTVESGGVVNATKSIIGVYTGSVGEATITGAGSQWNTSSYMYLASKPGAKGTMTITDSAAVSNATCYIGGYYSDAASAVADVTVSNNATWTNNNFYVGYYGSATLDIESGSVVTAAQTRIGMKAGSNGAMTVTGTGSALNASDNLVVGWSGISGTMTVTQGAVVSNTDGYVGYEDGGTGSAVISNGATWNNSASLNVGFRGNGTMNVTSGGVVNSTVGRISYAYTSSGEATVTGAGSQWNIDDYLLIGRNDGVGRLNIENGGVVNADGHVSLGQFGATATLSFNGGTLNTNTFYGDCANITGTGEINANGLLIDTDIVFDSTHGLVQDITGIGTTSGVTIHLDADGTGRMGAGYESAGSLTVTDGVVLNSTSSTLAYYPGSSATVSISGNGSEWNNTDGGIFLGYYGPATLSITDSGLFSSLGMTIDSDLIDMIPGAAADSFVQMKTGGQLALFTDIDEDGVGDDLSASIADFLTAIVGTSDAIQWWDEGSGYWASLTTATLGTDCTLEYLTTGDLAGYTLLTVDPQPDPNIPGDANKDGKVDGSDVTILANNWQLGVPVGGVAEWEQGDFNGDGMVDGSDVTILANNWQYGVTTAAATVPEPGMLIVLLGGIVTLLAIRRRK